MSKQREKNIFLLLSAIIAVNLFFSGCGVYGFRGNNPPEGIRTLAIPLFEDNSGFSQANIKENFTETLKNNIINDNTFRIADKSFADGIVKCTIREIRDEALVVSGNENVTQRKITILVDVEFDNLKKQKTVWRRTYSNYGEYNSSSATFSEREAGINTAVNKICEDIVNDLTSNW
ncbi:MAG: hypothetical protein FJ216_04735 [Ignavibacteria bacterium]|nr:hypothetical protein [Ignavibacteria bacterium]